MNREGKLSLIIFVNWREMKSSNKKEIQSLISSQKETDFFPEIYNFVLWDNFESIFLKITINVQIKCSHLIILIYTGIQKRKHGSDLK